MLVNLVEGDQNKSDFLEINPLGTVSVLEIDNGTIRTRRKREIGSDRRAQGHLLPVVRRWGWFCTDGNVGCLA
ncbi:MAG: hypothetical protein CL933_10905 [Deltaproteobacteria bacterium]|nr:hypothetical protein [Deltaproteobacteria bacterium]